MGGALMAGTTPMDAGSSANRAPERRAGGPGAREYGAGNAIVIRRDQPTIITIDGPAGTGKSSVALALAQRLGLDFLDTGAMYRAAALLSLEHRIALTREAPPTPEQVRALVELVERAKVSVDWTVTPPGVLAFGKALGERIRDKDVTDRVSLVAAIPELRRHLVACQREIAREHPRLVTEGRDQGSLVFPDAHVKFYLDADAQIRAARRALQVQGAGKPADVTSILRDILDRDRRDMSRSEGRLMRPEGSILVDTSLLTREEVISELHRLVRERLSKRRPAPRDS